ncbi:MAG: RHS repeat-associated core domain-containing protein, partial [Desulfobacterales bacterium]|nr:RHS repeat-associated core domain-containing protein [Desulfobacterales bacterium]
FEYADGRMPVTMTADDSSVYYLTYDQVGSLRIVTDVSGTVVKKVDCDSFGNVYNDSDPTFEVPFGFAGGLHDRDAGLVRFGYRDYDPDAGRWTAKDPIRFAGGDTDLYGYCLNDPIMFIDPYGLAKAHFDRLPDGSRAIHYGKYRFNDSGQLVDHGGRVLSKPEKGGTWKEAKKALKWLMGKHSNFFRVIPCLMGTIKPKPTLCCFIIDRSRTNTILKFFRNILPHFFIQISLFLLCN